MVTCGKPFVRIAAQRGEEIAGEKRKEMMGRLGGAEIKGGVLHTIHRRSIEAVSSAFIGDVSGVGSWGS
jgi:hypothetical protein